uniref:Uncharacterized protein n=1 Tax=Romanomermis culicivorax TaxID=13658 RepID=A0A915IEK1_ROMCU
MDKGDLELQWPDHGVPKRPQVFLDFLALVRQTISEMDEEQGVSLSFALLEKMKRGVLKKSPPVLLHCSAGVGRTGVYVLADLMIKCIDSKIPLKPWELVQKLRAQRKGMVQTEEQFVFACETALKYFDNKRY